MKFKLWSGFILLLIVAGGLVFAWWSLIGRWRPHTITRHQSEITQLLTKAGWVSPGLKGPKLYEIGFRSCEDCIRYRLQQFPLLQRAGVDTRVIMVARRDVNGVSKSTPAERSTVAELWANRKWPLLEQWEDTPVAAWTAPGIIPADNDTARSSIVEASRKLVDDLTPLLKDNGVESDGFRYPTLVWWDKQGRLRACACEKRQTYGHVRHELGA